MRTLKEIGKILNCTSNNVSWLLTRGVLPGVKKDGHWIVADEDIQNYLHSEKRRDTHLSVHKGDTFGYWTVLESDRRNKSGKRSALCRCICGKETLIPIFDLIHKNTESCGCKRNSKQTAEQKEGLTKGRKIMDKIQSEHIMSGLHRNLSKNSRTGHKGVSFMPKQGKYRAYITINRKQISLGCFASLDDAVKARKAGEEKYLAPYREKIEEIKGNL